MDTLYHLIQQYGLLLVFLEVLVEQLGAPVPAYPTLIITGAMAQNGQYPPLLLLLVAVAAALMADYVWYLAGRRYGRSIMSRLCRISLSPDSCVRQTESIYLRSPLSQQAGKIPGAVTISSHEIQTCVFTGPIEDEVVVYCACPDEASAAMVARQLMRRGYKKVRPLTGGIDAWRDAGYAIDV